jgi:hypothetical protein
LSAADAVVDEGLLEAVVVDFLGVVVEHHAVEVSS